MTESIHIYPVDNGYILEKSHSQHIQVFTNPVDLLDQILTYLPIHTKPIEEGENIPELEKALQVLVEEAEEEDYLILRRGKYTIEVIPNDIVYEWYGETVLMVVIDRLLIKLDNLITNHIDSMSRSNLNSIVSRLTKLRMLILDRL